ncbi:CBM35 domain-containing protein [Streptomyces sp. NPDC093600]|uniref:CBM35 domain-containing protein n=1 Tax=Streptomyces sp. NPDC093600 TaxID=3366047 RepID=UPI00380A850C
MAAGNDGANTPEDDDPFGYLYADGQAAGAQPPQGGGYGYPGPAAQPGVPRTSYNQVRTVGERQYGAPAQAHVPQQQNYGGQQQYGRPNPQYAAPETYPGGDRTRQSPMPPQRGRGPNTKGLLIGAIAVVAVVVIGITAAVLNNTGDKNADGSNAGGTPTGGSEQVQESPSTEPSAGETPPELPQQDAATLKLGGAALLAKDIKGAEGADGAYVNFNGVGGSVTWSADVPNGGEYTLFVTYSVPGRDAKTTLTVNGGSPRSLNMSNFAKAADGDWEKGWTKTYAFVNLTKGQNALKISCEQGDACDAILDQVSLKAGHVNG